MATLGSRLRAMLFGIEKNAEAIDLGAKSKRNRKGVASVGESQPVGGQPKPAWSESKRNVAATSPSAPKAPELRIEVVEGAPDLDIVTPRINHLEWLQTPQLFVDFQDPVTKAIIRDPVIVYSNNQIYFHDRSALPQIRARHPLSGQPISEAAISTDAEIASIFFKLHRASWGSAEENERASARIGFIRRRDELLQLAGQGNKWQANLSGANGVTLNQQMKQFQDDLTRLQARLSTRCQILRAECITAHNQQLLTRLEAKDGIIRSTIYKFLDPNPQLPLHMITSPVVIVSKSGNLAQTYVHEEQELRDYIRQHQQHPVTGQKATSEEIKADEKITQIMQEFRRGRFSLQVASLKSELGHCIRPLEVETKVTQLESDLQALDGRLEQRKTEILQEWQAQHEITNFKNQLRIDRRNHAHLQYWNEKTDRCWHGYGGKEIVFENRHYRVPTRIYYMMLSAGREYTTVADFKQNVDKWRQTKSWNPFSSVTRSAHAAAVYQAPDIDQAAKALEARSQRPEAHL